MTYCNIETIMVTWGFLIFRNPHIYIYMEVFWNRGTPKSSFLMVFSIINYPFGGTHPTSPRGVRLQEAIHTALPGISVILLCGPSLFVPAPWSPPGHGIPLSLDETNGDSSWVSSTVTSWSSWRIPMVQAREDFLNNQDYGIEEALIALEDGESLGKVFPLETAPCTNT